MFPQLNIWPLCLFIFDDDVEDYGDDGDGYIVMVFKIMMMLILVAGRSLHYQKLDHCLLMMMIMMMTEAMTMMMKVVMMMPMMMMKLNMLVRRNVFTQLHA